MSTPANIDALATAGTSVWLDDLSRDRLRTGNLAEVIAVSYTHLRAHET